MSQSFYLESWVADVDDPGPSQMWTGKFYIEGHPRRKTWACYGDGHSPQDAAEDAERAKIAASAPALVRALLAVTELPGCQHQIGLWEEIGPKIDQALTAAGFPDQVSRDEARKRIAEANR